MAQFGELLAELRKDRNLTQKELADILFVTAGTVSNYEKGVHFPDVEKLIHIAEYFQVTTDYLLGRCVSRLPPDVFEEMVWENKTAGEVIQDIRNMTPDRKHALAVIMHDMELGRLLNQYHNKEKA